MSRRGPSWGNSYRLQSFFQLFYRYRSFYIFNSQRQQLNVTVEKLGHGYSMHQLGLHLISRDINGVTWRSKHERIDIVKEPPTPTPAPAPAPTPAPDPAPTPAPAPSRFNFAFWIRWLLGSILSLLLPNFWKQRWEKLKKIEGETAMVVEEVENVAEVVEKVSAEVADLLPDNTKLKEAAFLVENASKEVAQDAQLTINFIQKVNELEEDLNDLEKMVEPIIDKIVQHESKVTNKNDS